MSQRTFSLFAIALCCLMAFMSGLKSPFGPIDYGKINEKNFFVNYIIPKISTYIPRFSLLDRVFVDRRKNKAADQGNATAATPKPMALPMVKPPLPAVKPVAPIAPSKVATGGPQLDVDVIGSDKEGTKIKADETPINYGGANQPAPSEEKKSVEAHVGEWLQKIYQNPTRTTMNELIDAYLGGKIEPEAYLQIMTTLLEDRSVELQKLALYAMAATPSHETLSLLLSLQAQLSGETSSLQKIILDAYINPEHIEKITQTLTNSNEVVVLGALPLAAQVGQKIRLWLRDEANDVNGERNSNSGSGYRTTRRNNSTSNNSALQKIKADYKRLIEGLEQLSRDSSSLIARNAENTLQQMTYRPSTLASAE